MSLRICLIGCGGIARDGHGPSLRRCVEQGLEVTLAACCDLDAARAADFARRFGFARSYSDLARMLAEEKPDAVWLAVPIEHTCRIGCEVMRRGRSLLTEKPPGRDVAEADELIAAAARGGAINQVAVNRRFSPVLVALKQWLAEASSPDNPSAGVQHVSFEMARVQRPDPDFSTTAIHGIDAVRFVLDADYADLRFRYREMPELGEGVANHLLDGLMSSGVTVQLAFCPMTGDRRERLTVHATDRTFHAELALPSPDGDRLGELEERRAGKVVRRAAGPSLAASDELCVLSGMYGQSASFIADLLAGRQPAVSLASVRQSVAVADAMRERRPAYRAAVAAADGQ
ncbi:MAG: Gfo/Idh/MocA family oxidoreductase [Phycisphaeraceae bacterium]